MPAAQHEPGDEVTFPHIEAAEQTVLCAGNARFSPGFNPCK